MLTVRFVSKRERKQRRERGRGKGHLPDSLV